MSKRTLTERQKARKARKATAQEQRASEWVKAHGGVLVTSERN